MNVGGNMYSRMGAMDLYFTKVEDESDLGRFSVTGNEADRHAFKVPSLRLAVKSAPYFHDGSIATLEEAVSTMARYQLGREISDQDTALIIDFLHSLVGKPYEVPEQ
nr:hypothetical protein [Candidatus Reidiella endopervernicosa]